MKAILIRTYFTDRTEGVLVVVNDAQKVVFSCNTLELPNLNNERQKSCIPEGEYNVAKHTSPTKGECYEVENVPNRGNILIHVGNYTRDSLGCILVGEKWKNAVMRSKVNLTALKKVAPNGFKLKICSFL